MPKHSAKNVFSTVFGIVFSLLLLTGGITVFSYVAFGSEWNSFSITVSIIGSIVVSLAMMFEVFVLLPDRAKRDLENSNARLVK